MFFANFANYLILLKFRFFDGPQFTPNCEIWVKKKKPTDQKNNRSIDSFRLREIWNKNSLLKACRIHAVSTSVKEIFEKHGINHNKIAVNQHGVKAVDWIEKKVWHFTQYPILFGF